MKPEELRAALEESLKIDPYDEVAHRAYADCLEEYGGSQEDDDTAAFHRRWTPEVQKSIEWLTDYAADIKSGWDKERNPEIALEELLSTAKKFLNTGEEECLNFDTPDRVFEDRKEFWVHFHNVTGVDPGEDQDATIFRCAC